ncbi:MAG: hypothetical protein Q6M54_01705 [Thermostichus sp. DRC_bins_24]
MGIERLLAGGIPVLCFLRSLTTLAVGGQPMATWHAHFYVFLCAAAVVAL